MFSIQQWAALWDLDGTLVDTAELHFAAWQRLCEEEGLSFSRADFAATFGKRNPEILEYLFGASLAANRAIDLGRRKEEYYRAAAAAGVSLLPGVGNLLAELARQGIPQALATSAPRDNVDLILSLTNTTGFFQAIVSAEDTSRGKPDPEVFLTAAKRLGVAPGRCVVFEDAVAGVQAAKAGGMKCIAVCVAGHHSQETLLAAGADIVSQTLTQLTLERLSGLFSAQSAK